LLAPELLFAAEDRTMPADHAAADTQKLELPKDLVSALQNSAQRPQTDYGIESLKPSFFGRLMEKLIAPKD
jgi:hypothetical protein